MSAPVFRRIESWLSGYGPPEASCPSCGVSMPGWMDHCIACARHAEMGHILDDYKQARITLKTAIRELESFR